MTTAQQLTDWNTCAAKSEHVQISTSRIYLSVRGPPRALGKPVVLCESGAAMSGNCWIAVARLLEPHVRVFYYDRAGTGRSSMSSLSRSASNMAAELSELLRVADIPPPYITLGHSYAGIITREFLARCSPGEIVGMLFVDGNQEKTHQTIEIPFDATNALMVDLDFLEVTGFNQTHKLTSEEYKMVFQDETTPSFPNTFDEEKDHFAVSCAELEEKRQFENKPMGKYPVTVIKGNSLRDWTLMCDAAKAKNVGTEEQRKEVEEFLGRVEAFDEHLQREVLLLSEDSRWVQAENSGHLAQMTDPQLVADEVLKIVKAVEQVHSQT